MSDYYIRPTGADANDGLSWAGADATLLGSLAGAMVAGDRLFMSNLLNDTVSATARTFTFPGTPNAPVQLYSVPDGVSPPSAVSNGATITSTGSGGNVLLYGSFVAHGLTVAVGSGSAAATLSLGTSTSVDVIQVYNDSVLQINTTASSGLINVGSSAGTNNARSRFIFNNVDIKFTGSLQSLAIYQELNWRGGSYTSVHGSQSYLFRCGSSGRGSFISIDGVDFTNISPGADIFSGANCTGRATIRNSLLPPNWTGQLVQGVIDPGFRATMHNCDSGATRIRMNVAAFSGTIRSDTGVLKQNGAVDSGVSYSWRMETNANPTPGMIGLESEEQFFVIPSTGAPLTFTIDVLTDGVTLTDADVWVEVQECGAPKSTFYRSRVVPLGAPKAIASSTAAWAAASMVAPRPQRLSLTFTPQTAGGALWKITLARPNTVMYVDPKRAA